MRHEKNQVIEMKLRLKQAMEDQGRRRGIAKQATGKLQSAVMKIRKS